MRKMIMFVVAAIVFAGAAVATYVWIANPGKPAVKQSSTGQQASNSAVIIQTKTDATLGQYLADGNGKALYTYGGDTQGVSNCTGACLYSWPVYEATVTTNLPAHVTIITRDDGTKQYAYKGLPLYGFSGDSAGAIRGNNLSNFHVAKP